MYRSYAPPDRTQCQSCCYNVDPVLFFFFLVFKKKCILNFSCELS